MLRDLVASLPIGVGDPTLRLRESLGAHRTHEALLVGGVRVGRKRLVGEYETLVVVRVADGGT
jgi:hypothetical protein